MKDIQQLIKKENSQEYKDIYPKTFTDAVLDKHTGANLADILNSFNMYFIAYAGSKEVTRVQVPTNLRRKGLWITYIMLDDTIVTEYYNGSLLTDDAWQDSANWVNSMQPFDKFSKKNMTCRFDNFTDKSTSSKLMTVKQGGEIVFSTTDNRFYYLHRDVLYAYWEVKGKPSNTEFQYKDSVYTDKLFLCKDRAYVMYNGTLVDIARFTIDKELSLTSNNPIANSTVTKKINEVNADATTALTLARELKEEGRFQINGNVTNNPDEEDITVEENKLKFKDKNYNAGEFSGLGRVYLRKNIVNGKNVLTQEMMNKPNTIYIIQYDYDLDNEEINIPENCTLDFQGGSLKNGKLKLNYYSYLNCKKNCFNDIKFLSGNITNEAKLSWFVTNDNNTSDIIQNLIDNFGKIFLDKPNIIINKPIKLKSYKIINGGNISISNNFKELNFNGEIIKSAFYFTNHLVDTTIKNINIFGKYKIDFGITSTNDRNDYFIKSNIKNISIRQVIKSAIRLSAVEYGVIDSIYIENCGCGIYINVKEFDYNNILNLNLGESASSPNLIKITNSAILLCNYGIIANFGSDLTIDRCEIAHISCYDVYVVNGQNLSITNYYSEGSGRATRWIDENGITGDINVNINKTMVSQLTNTHLGEYNIQKKYWGIVDSNKQDRHIRPIIYINCFTTYLHNLFISYNTIRNNITNVLDFSNNEKIGIDSFFYIKSKVDINSVNIYNNSGIISNLPYLVYFLPSNISTTLNINSLPYEYFNKDCIYISTKYNYNYISDIINIKTKFRYLDINSQYENIYNACYETDFNSLTNILNISDKKVYKKNNLFLFRSLNRNKGFLIPKSYFNSYGSNILILSYNKNLITSQFKLKIYGIKETIKTLIEELDLTMDTLYFEYGYFLNKEYIDIYENIAIEINNYNNVNVWHSVPIFINPYMNNSLNITQTLYPKKGTTAQRPTEVQIGFTYKDTDLNKWIIWNGEAWENIDGAALG